MYNTEIEEQNKALILKWCEEYDKGNLDVFIEIFAPDFLYYDPSNSPNPMFKRETYEFLIAGFKLFKDVNHTINFLFTMV